MLILTLFLLTIKKNIKRYVLIIKTPITHKMINELKKKYTYIKTVPYQ